MTDEIIPYRIASGSDEAVYQPPAALVDRLSRQESRYQLRSTLRRVTSVPRVRSCGLPLGGGIRVRVRDGVHHYSAPFVKYEHQIVSGMSTCGSGWICPVCSAKIRYHRADEVSRAMVSALDQGMNALFVTRTLPHGVEDNLGTTLSLLAEGRRYVTNQQAVKAARKAAGYIGSIAAKEITYGVNGWHPHTHDIEFYEHDLSLADFATLSGVYHECLSRFYSQSGFDNLSRQYGVRVEQAMLNSGALATYIAKAQVGTAVRLHTAHELARADLKQGRAGALTPFDIACGFFETGDMALLDLWHEYERETRGRSVVRFTKGLRARLLPHEAKRTDEELAALKIGGTDVVRFEGWLYRKIARVPGLEGKVLTALDTGGFAALVELLTVYRMDGSAGYEQVQGKEGML